MTLSDHQRLQITLTASTLAGLDADEQAVADQVTLILARLDPVSTVGSTFRTPIEAPNVKPGAHAAGTEVTVTTGGVAPGVGSAGELVDEPAVERTFRGIILHVDQELSSTRGIVFLKTELSKWHENGRDLVRTDRVDGKDGLEMAALAQSLTGHEVMVTVAVEKTATGTSRTLRGLRDMSGRLVDNFDANTPNFAPDFSQIRDINNLRSVAAQRV